ncbi:MAG: glycosyltransferase [Promethearchaeota archaeon]
MNIFNQIFPILENLLVRLITIKFFLIFLTIIVVYHILLYFLRDRTYINAVRKYKDPEVLTINDLKDLPLVNIIVPAWKESDLFRQCLISITKLNYPKIKAIVNAGGNEETLNIANSFRKYDNFIILHQKGGGSRPSLGKIKALNECLPYVSEGLLYMVDADVYFTDETFIRMIYPLINLDEKVVVGGIRPFKSLENKNLTKYLLINRNINFKTKFSRYKMDGISGANTCLKYEVIKAIGKFSEDNIYGEDRSRGEDIISQGFKIYKLKSYRGGIFCDFPRTIKEWIYQKIRWNENFLIYSSKKNKLQLIKSIFLSISSFFLIILPIYLFLYIQGFIFGIFIFIYLYLLKIRKYLFFKFTNDKDFTPKLGLIFFIKIIFYIYLEILIKFLLPFHLFYFKRKLKIMKNSIKYI